MKIGVALLALHIYYAAGACSWSECVLNVQIFGYCPPGTTASGESKDCGEKTCLFGCFYTHSEYMCCTSDCAWYDVQCNWDAVQGYFINANDNVKEAWSQLDQTIQDKLTTAEKFSSLTIQELQNLNTELLAELKSVNGMNLEQFKAVVGKIHDMAVSSLQDFLSNLSPLTLEFGLESLQAYTDWTQEKIAKIKDRLAQSDIWGALPTWNSTVIGKLGGLISGFDVDSLKAFANDALARAASLVNLTSSQLGGLGQKMAGMTPTLLRDMLDGVKSSALADAMSQLTAMDFSWAADQVALFKEQLTSSDAWGAVTAWSSEAISKLGNMLQQLDLETLRQFADDALAQAANLGKLAAQQIGALGKKLYNMTTTNLESMLAGLNLTALAESIGQVTGIDLAWASAQVVAFVERLRQSEAWGSLTTWTTSQLEKLGSMLASLPADLMTQLDDFSLSNAVNLIKVGAEELGKLGAKVFGMTITNLKSLLNGVNATSLCEGLQGLTSGGSYWLPEQAQAFREKLLSPETCGQAVTWTKEKIGALGTMLTSLNASDIAKFANAALARAKNLANLSANTIIALRDKFGGMELSDFTPMLNGLDMGSIHAAMLSQCDIQCQSDQELDFLTNPTIDNAAADLDAYAEKVKAKANGAALAYAKGFCSDSANSYDEAFAEMEAEKYACVGSAAKTNVASTSFESWSDSQTGALLLRLTEQPDAFGSLSTWSEKQMASLCHQYASFTPSNIAAVSSSKLIAASADVAINAALVGAFGPLAPVASYAITKASDSITPEQRESWAAKFKEGLGNLKEWGCEQVASLRSMVAGLDADDLTALPLKAIKGLVANAISAMNSSQVRGFSPNQVITMVEKVRKRIHGHLIRELNVSQIVAVVCGALNSTSAAWCPPAAVDVTIGVPAGSLPSEAEIIAHFATKLGVPEAQVKILLNALESALPVKMASGRRLSSATEPQQQVAVRVGLTDTSRQLSLTQATQNAAHDLASANGGQITEDALSYSTTTDSSIITATPITTTSPITTVAPGSTQPAPGSTTEESTTSDGSTGQGGQVNWALRSAQIFVPVWIAVHASLDVFLS